jgi:N-acetylglucosamine kinase-like BadF-type ATPase
MIERFGTLENTAASVYGAPNPIEVVASFSKSVADAANEGDEISIEILRCAAQDLAMNVQAAARRSNLVGTPFSYSTAGGVFNIGPLVEKPFHDFMAQFLPEASYQKPLGGAITGAQIMAMNKAPGLEQVTTRIGAN